MKPLVDVLCDPGITAGFQPRQWQLLIRQSRRSGLAPRLGHILDRECSSGDLPDVVADVLHGSAMYVDYIQRRLRYEVGMLERIASDVDYPVVLVKGAAYVVEGIPAGEGRSVNDIDVLVPQWALGDFESRLAEAGWKFDDSLTDYDDRYYRELSHELPPMRHPDCYLELDVHYGILQPTHRLRVPFTMLFDTVAPIVGSPLKRLSRHDQVLHSATHLFMSDELRGGLRDLHDILLLCQKGEQEEPGFWQALVRRARQLNLEKPLYYAFYCSERLFPSLVSSEIKEDIPGLRPAGVGHRVAQALFLGYLSSAPEGRRFLLVRQMLYLRSHLVRMPFGLLVRHLARKYLRLAG